MWTVPTLVLIAALVVWLTVFTGASSRDSLPSASAESVVGAVRTNSPTGYSGTLVADTSLGLPAAPPDGTSGGQAVTAIVSGSYTMRYWYGGSELQRVALLDPSGETDYFRAGQQIWEWDSADRVANRVGRPLSEDFAIPTSFAGLTPQQLADRAIASIDADTTVTLGAQTTVAGQACYQLVIAPGQASGTRIGSVHIAVDGRTHVPLAVQIFPRTGAAPSVDVSFSSVTYKRPAGEYFEFTPPADSKVSDLASAAGTNPVLGAREKTIGTGWTAVARYSASATDIGKPPDTTLKPVEGSFGNGVTKGVLFQSPVLSILALRDNRVYVGAVEADKLYEIASADQ
jgi:hypothetical protein